MVVSLVPCPFQGVGILCTRSLSGTSMPKGCLCLGEVRTRDLGYQGYGWQADSIHPTRMLSCFKLDFALLDKVMSGNDTLNCTERVKMV